MKNNKICGDLGACTAVIDFEGIVPTTCGAFCASYGLQCEDSNDEKRNKCDVVGSTEDQFDCSTEIDSGKGYDAICYCADA